MGKLLTNKGTQTDGTTTVGRILSTDTAGDRRSSLENSPEAVANRDWLSRSPMPAKNTYSDR